MRVAFIVDKFPVLSQTFILDQITGLIDLGVEVRIFADSRDDLETVHPDVTKYGLEDLASYACDIPKSKGYRLLKGIKLVGRAASRRPFKTIKFLAGLMLNARKDPPLRLLCWIDQFYDEKFDIIYCHFGPVGKKALPLKRFGLEAALVTVFHGYDLSRYLLEHDADVYDELFELGDMFLPISDYWKNKLIDIGCDQKKITVHHMGSDIDRFQFRERGLSPDESVKLLTVGRLTEKKGQEYVIKALGDLVEKGLNFKYTIAGEGPQEEHLKALVSSLNLQDKVDFTGAVSRDRVIELYDRSHIFILTSITAADGDQEGVPVVLMEAQACGLPVLSTFHTGIPELVKDGKSGFLVPEKDSQALAEKLEYLIENSRQWPQMGQAGRDIVCEDYNTKKLNRRLLNLFQELLTNNEDNKP